MSKLTYSNEKNINLKNICISKFNEINSTKLCLHIIPNDYFLVLTIYHTNADLQRMAKSIEKQSYLIQKAK